MKNMSKRLLTLLLALSILCSSFVTVSASTSTKITTTATGYTKASDVDYVVVDGTVVNWGARGEDCIFLTTYALDFYPSGSTYADLSRLSGSSNQNSVPNSPLYDALQDLMVSKHTNIQTYDMTRPYYMYTDCVSNNYSKLSAFYSGTLVNSAWDSGKTYNREHIWPDSKCLSAGSPVIAPIL